MLRLLIQVLLVSILLGPSLSALSLSEALETAKNENRTIAVLRQQLKESAEVENQAASAYLPQFELNGSYNYISRLPELKLGEQLPIQLPKINFSTHNQLDFSLSAGYLLFDWGQRGKRVQQAKAGYKVQELALQAAQDQVAYQTIKAYSVAALAKEREVLLQKYVENADTHLVDAQNKYDNGLVSEFDLLKSQLQLKVFSEELTVAQADLQQALLKLSEVVGADSGKVVTVDQTLSELQLTIPPDDEINKILTQKPEVELTRKQIELSGLQEQVEKLRPKVTIYSSAGWRNNYLPNPDDLLFNFAGGAKVSYRFFDGGLSHHKQAEEQAKQVRLQLEIDKITSEATRSVAVVREDLNKIEAKRSATAEKLQVARKALEIASVSYGAGLITNSEYLDTELEIKQIELDALKDRYDLLQAQLELKNAVGYWPEME